MDKLTSRFQQALADAQSLAVGRDHQFMEHAHVLLALLDGQGGSVRPLLLKAGVNVNKLRSDLEAQLDRLRSPRAIARKGLRPLVIQHDARAENRRDLGIRA